ncbi:MAG: RNA polymerase sigma factor [Elusimicrobiota bacterium]
MSENDPDAALVELVRRGDAEAFGVLVMRHQRLLTSVAAGLMNDPARTEDVVQEAVMSAWKAFDGYRGEAQFKNWLCRIVVHKAYSALRWGRLRAWLSLDSVSGAKEAEGVPDYSAGSDPEKSSLEEERAEAIRRAVGLLPLQMRTAVLLRGGGLGVTEVAQTMGVAEGTVKAHLHQARQRLGQALGEV